MKKKKSEYICARCGLPVYMWHYGWKHSRGWRSPPSCGQTAKPTKRVSRWYTRLPQ